MVEGIGYPWDQNQKEYTGLTRATGCHQDIAHIDIQLNLNLEKDILMKVDLAKCLIT